MGPTSACGAVLSLIATSILLSKGVCAGAVNLSSDPDVRGASVCPSTNVTFTCFAGETSMLEWQVDGVRIRRFFVSDFTNIGRSFLDNVFLVTLINISSESNNGPTNFTSTLKVSADEVESGTNITCRSFSEMKSISLVKASRPSPPSNVVVETLDFQTEKFSIKLLWDSQDTAVGDTFMYRIVVNSNEFSVGQSTNMFLFEGEYNNDITISISATNCAGDSDEVIEEVHEVGCPAPATPENGSVSGFTSARVGANVTYQCEDGLEPEEETVATCSMSMQWMPATVMCIPPGSGDTTDTTTATSIPTTTPMDTGAGSSLSTAEVVAISAVVAGLCSFTAGLLLGVLLTRCGVHCHRKQKRGQTERPPVYEDIQLDEKAGIELKHNEAYGHISR